MSCWPFPSLLVNWCLWADNAASLIHNSWNTTHPRSLPPSLFHLCLKLAQCQNYCCCADNTNTLLFFAISSDFRIAEIKWVLLNSLLSDVVVPFIAFAGFCWCECICMCVLLVCKPEYGCEISPSWWGLRGLQHPLFAERGTVWCTDMYQILTNSSFSTPLHSFIHSAK